MTNERSITIPNKTDSSENIDSMKSQLNKLGFNTEIQGNKLHFRRQVGPFMRRDVLHPVRNGEIEYSISGKGIKVISRIFVGHYIIKSILISFCGALAVSFGNGLEILPLLMTFIFLFVFQVILGKIILEGFRRKLKFLRT